MSASPLLELAEVTKEFSVEPSLTRRMLGTGRTIRAVDRFCLSVDPGEVVGLVGESGCGKTTTAFLICRLLQASAGSIHFGGEDIGRADKTALRRFRERVQMVFQDSHSALNPRKTIRRTLLEPLRMRHGKAGGLEERAIELLAATGLGPEVMPRYPHELSGGQRQRVGIARALAVEPELIVLDEPVSSLDVSLQAQIINVLKALREERGLTMLLISHDLALVNHLCDRVVVMYAGRAVETGPPETVMRNASHPYTRALVAAVPRGLQGRGKGKPVLAGSVEGFGAGCLFAPRCPDAMPVCHEVVPQMTPLSSVDGAACHLLGDGLQLEGKESGANRERRVATTRGLGA